MKLRTIGLLVLLACCATVALAAAGPASADSGLISAEQTAAIAANRLEPTADGVLVRHPRRTVEFAPDGVRLRPRHGAPEWRWSLVEIASSSGRTLIDPGPVAPVMAEHDLIRYDRCAVLEDYRLKVDSFEQLLVIPEPLPLGGEDLVVAGVVTCDGDLAENDDGWAWHNARGEVTLGRVTVLDAGGEQLPARLEVTPTSTRIVVDGSALVAAAYPVTIDPEIGSNDYRISDMGGVHDIAYMAFEPAVRYNSISNEYLVVWRGDDNTGGLVDNEMEIFGQLLSATGGEVGSNDFRISDVGGTGSTAAGAVDPDVAFNSTSNQYLVVWSADDPVDGVVDEEYEIWGQVLEADGGELFTNDFRISFTGGSGNPLLGAFNPAVVYNPHADEYLVVWEALDSLQGMESREYEIFAQRVDSTGILVGPSLRLSDMGGSGDYFYQAHEPDVVYNSSDLQYLTVWYGSDNVGGLVYLEFEIYGQLITWDGAETGPNDFRISDMGDTGDSHYDAYTPNAAYNPTLNEYLVVWHGDDNVGGLVNEEFEVFGQLITWDGAETGPNDFRLSDAGGVGDLNYYVWWGPELAYNQGIDRYLVVWAGEDNVDGMVDDEWEIFVQALTPDIQEFGANDERISDVGGLGNDWSFARDPAVAANSTNGQFLVAWNGNDNVGGFGFQLEIFIQRVYVSATDIFVDGFETGDTSAWPRTVP